MATRVLNPVSPDPTALPKNSARGPVLEVGPSVDSGLTPKALKRLRAAALVYALGTLLNSLPNWLIPTESRTDIGGLQPDALAAHALIVIAGALFSLLSFLIFDLDAIPERRRKFFGHVFVICIAAFTAASTHLQERTGVTWVGVLIVSFPLLVPSRPQTAAISTGIAALTSPAALFLAYGLGFRDAPPTLTALVVTLTPNLICMGIGLVGAHIFMQLGEEVRAAKAAGAYLLQERLGEGGMGEVWTAKHRLLKRLAAVKLIRSESGSDPATRQRFERETQVASSLTSPHSVRIYDFGQTDEGALYLVMELLEGDDLQKLIQRTGALDIRRTKHLLLQACDALHEAHSKGFVHRDIKPSNILVGRRGGEDEFLTILDFGLSKSFREEATELTGNDAILGTPAFLAPEQAMGSAAVNDRCDIYALGAVAFYMLTDQYVFSAETPIQLVMKHVNEAAPPPSRCSELVIPPEVDATVLRCLEKSPDKRPSAANLKTEIRSWPV